MRDATPAQKIIAKVFREEWDRQHAEGKIGPEASVRAERKTAARLHITRSAVVAAKAAAR